MQLFVNVSMYLFVLCNNVISSPDYKESNDKRRISKHLSGKYGESMVKGAILAQFEVLSGHVSVSTEENHRIQIKIVTSSVLGAKI
jgi:hypothetical protein